MSIDPRQAFKYWEDQENPFALSKIAARPGFHMKPPGSPKFGMPAAPPMSGGGELDDALTQAGPLPQAPPPTGIATPPRSMGRQQGWIESEDPFYSEWESDWNSAASKRDALLRNKPKLGAAEYERPGWQKALMVAANAGAGYLNAGGRVRVNPIDQKTLMDRPKYNQAMDAWGAEGKAADTEMSTLQTKYALRRQQGQDERANRLLSRQERQAEQQEALNESLIKEHEARARDLDEIKTRPPADMNLGEAGIWNPVTKSIYPGTARQGHRTGSETQEEKYAAYTAQANKLAEAGVIKMGSAEYKYMVANGRLPNERRGGGGSSGVEERFEKTQAAKELQNQRKMQTDIQEIEYGVPGKPGLWDERSKILKAMVPFDANKPTDPNSPEYKDWLRKWQRAKASQDPDSASRAETITNQLRNITKQKRDNGWIDDVQYQKIMQGLAGGNPDAQSQAASTGGRVAPPPPTPPASSAATPQAGAAPQAAAAPAGGGEDLVRIRDRKTGKFFRVPKANLATALKTADLAPLTK
jgi:hypothetical protein